VLVLCGLLLFGPPTATLARDPGRARQIAEVEKQLAELKQKLAELRKAESAGPPARKPIELADILAWRRVGGSSLSPDGKWFAYRVSPAEGKSEVVARRTDGDQEYKFPAGGPGFGTLSFAPDSKWLAFNITPPRRERTADRETSERPGPRRAEAKVGLVNLSTGAKVEYEGVRRFAFAGEAGGWVALHRTPPATATAAPETPPGPPRRRARGAPEAPAAEPAGTDLILRQLATGKELTIGNVSEFAFDKKGLWLALLINARDEVGSGVQLRDMKTGALRQLESDKASYRALNWAEKGDGFTVVKGVEDKALQDRPSSVLGFTDLAAAEPKVIRYDPKTDPTFPKGMTVSAARPAFFADDLGAVFFSIHEPRKADPKKAADRDPEGPRRRPGAGRGKGKDGPDDPAGPEKPDLVLWHWLDERLQSEQQVRARFEHTANYLCMYRARDKKFLRLADDALPQVTVVPGQRWAVALHTRGYERMGSLDGRRHQDVHVIDLQTGKNRLALRKNRWYFGPSPRGTHFLYYDGGKFFTHELATGKDYPITNGAPVSFVNVEDDHNVDRPPTRPLGWAKDDSAVLLSDNWDVWKLPVHGGAAVNLTGNGRKDGIRYRSRISLDPEGKGVDLAAPVYFSMYGEWTKKSGYARLEPGATALRVLCWGDAQFSALAKAKGADTFVYTRETYKDYPDFRATDGRFSAERLLTKVNPQQDKFLWSGGARLLEYKSAKGDRLQAALLLPANYEKGKSYPTIVYIYERLSDRLHHYAAPTASGFNPAVYASNGYAVLLPDIRYKVNDPGMSAVWCVLPALEAAVATGVVDKTKVGLHGHSWGGYQTSFLITQTNAFKAAAAGAPLTNLVSMYSLIYWNTGWTNQPIFESSQGRFTGGYWEELEAFLRNSPVFHAKNVKTPLLLLHNDKDGAVDWTQGIEYFNTLRRLHKPVVMLQYKGENHGLLKPANQRDYTRRMREFFDHHLRGKPAPSWLEKGVRHADMERHLEERAKE
jgi:dienelactone hydrolase